MEGNDPEQPTTVSFIERGLRGCGREVRDGFERKAREGCSLLGRMPLWGNSPGASPVRGA
ncbi:hypothetical protein GCM10018987_33350 [Streptomyces cremeus]